MMCSRKILAGVAAVMLLSASTKETQAQVPGCVGYGYGYDYGYALHSMFSTRGLPPYFALFPPVYYSIPVARTYGYSPFAYPPGTPTPEVVIEPTQTGMMVNPYVPRGTVVEPKSHQTTGGPRTIVNPFADGRQELALSEAK